jgi:F-type H+-transporting ATPase subunit b
MALAKGSKALLAMLGVGYLLFLGIFFYQSVVRHGLKTVPSFETVKLRLPDPQDEAALEKFTQDYVGIEVVPGEGNTGRYKVKQLTSRSLKQRLEKGEEEILAADAGQAGRAESFAKLRYLTGAPVKADDGKIVLNKGIKLGLMQMELLTRNGIAGKKDIPVQGHGQIIGINATMGFVILNFLVLVALLYGLLWDPITRMLDERAGSIRKDIEQAAASREDAEKLKERYEQALANARSEANRMRQEKIREGDAQKDKIITRARDEARRLSEDAKAQVETAIVEAKWELRKEIGSISVEIAARVLAKEVDQSVHRQLIDEFLRNLETENI